MQKAVYLLVVPGFADWEPAHAIAELRRHGGYRVEVVALTGAPVESMGGMVVRPSKSLREVDIADMAVFILPGGDRWEKEPVEPEITDFLHRIDRAGVPIAAICAGTTVVARAGLIRGRRHTSNGLGYLRDHAPGYADAASYVDEPAVRDAGLITATGLGDVEFASALMAELGVLDEPNRAVWTKLFRSGRIPKGAA
jgi:putative intracellular protease/amidase